MNKPLKTLSLLISAISAVPIIAIDQNQEEAVVTKKQEIEAQNAVVTPGAQEECNKKSNNAYNSVYNFLSKNKWNIVCGLISIASLYFLIYKVMPEISLVKQLKIEDQVFVAKIKILREKLAEIKDFRSRVSAGQL